MMENGSKKGVEEILEDIQKLSVDERIELLEKVLGNSGLVVTLGNNSLKAENITQINIMSREDASELLRIIARRIGEKI